MIIGALEAPYTNAVSSPAEERCKLPKPKLNFVHFTPKI